MSLLQYGLTVAGSCTPDDLLARIDVRIVNTASRRITGLPIFTRIAALRFLAETQSIRNLYVRHRAEFLHAAQCSHGGGVQRRLQAEVCAVFQVGTLGPKAMPLRMGVQESYLYPPVGLQDELLESTCWIQSANKTTPAWSEVRGVGGIFFPNATKIRRETREYRGFCSFKDTYSWLDKRLQVLRYVGWRPECSQALELNVARALPPDVAVSRLELGGGHTPEERYPARGGVRRLMTQVWVVAEMIRVDEVCATVVMPETDYRARFCSGYVHGVRVGETGSL